MLTMLNYFELLCEEFSKLSNVEAIVLGGSRAGDNFDEKSDYDLYIYCTSLPCTEVRKGILDETCQYTEIGNQFWEFEDDCTLKDGIDIDILYRNIDDFEKEIHKVVEEHVAYNGYTTCMWHNLINSKIIYDPKGMYKELQKKYTIPYPKALRDSIITNNLKLLSGMLPSYDGQIAKAVKRGDIVSINHRVAAFMEAYFDIIFAMNDMTHPGEKRMIEKAIEGAKVLPENFEENINMLYSTLFANPDEAVSVIAKINKELQEVLKRC